MKPFLTPIFACAIGAAALATGCLPAFAVTPSEVASSLTVNVRDFGAKGDGRTDDTGAFEAAMKTLAGKGGIVSVPAGNYMIKTHLTVPAMVTLEGVWRSPTSWTQNKGATLLAVEGAGSEEGPAFITLNANSTIKGLTVFYPNQDPSKIAAYPWCVRNAPGDNCAIIDCLLVNPYQAVDFGTNPSGRHYIRNLYGQPLRRGIFVDKCLDIGRIENVHFWPFWTWEEKTGIRDWLWKNGEAFIFGRTDWEYVFNTFCFGYRVGYRFIKTKDGAMNGNLLGIAADAANIAVLVEETQLFGLLITNGEFVAMGGPKPTEVVVKDTHTGTVQFSNCSFWGPGYQIASIAGRGNLTFNACNFVEWDTANQSVPAIDVSGGKVTVSASYFMKDAPQMNLRADAQSAIFMGNHVAGNVKVTNPASASLQVGLNAEPKRPVEQKGAIVVDDSDGLPEVSFTKGWIQTRHPGTYHLGTHWAWKGSGTERATFRPLIPRTGSYDVYVYVSADANEDHATNAPVTVRSRAGLKTVHVDLSKAKGAWKKIGTFTFAGGQRAEITFTNNANGNVVADAVKLTPHSK
ncbi:MAG: hypothetical protein IT209_08350 [Armatimonadetes bacterium]|nr:hypothetical protein [Armatimonadota bacterium]